MYALKDQLQPSKHKIWGFSMKYCATSYLLVSPWSWNSESLCEFHTFLALRHANICWNWKSEVIHLSTISALLLMTMRGLREVSTLVLKQIPVLGKMRNVPASLLGTFPWAPQPCEEVEKGNWIWYLPKSLWILHTLEKHMSWETGLDPPNSDQPNPGLLLQCLYIALHPLLWRCSSSANGNRHGSCRKKKKKSKTEVSPNSKFIHRLH